MTGLRLRRMPNRACWGRSAGSTALPVASNRLEATPPISASSSTETELPAMRDEDRTMANSIPVDRYRALRLIGALAGLSVALGACTTGGEVVTASIPD